MLKGMFISICVCIIFSMSLYAGIPIDVVNGSFEEPSVPVGYPVIADPNGWVSTYYNPSLVGDTILWNAPNPGSEFIGGFPDGVQVAAGSGVGKVVQLGQTFDLNAAIGDAYVAAAYFGQSNTWGGSNAAFELAVIPDASVVGVATATVKKYYSSGDFAMTQGQWTQVLLFWQALTATDAGKDMQLSVRVENNMCVDDVRLYKISDNDSVGGTLSWADAASWVGGLPVFHDYANVTNGSEVTLSNAAVSMFGMKINGGSTLTIGSGADVQLFNSTGPGFLLGQTGDATLIVDGGVINQAYTYGGDFKAGLSNDSTVNIEMRSGTWNVRSLRLAESGEFVNWPDAVSDGIVTSTVNMLQTGGTIDGTTAVGTAAVYLGNGAGSTATYTMNGGTLKNGNLRISNKGNFDQPSSATFTLNGGEVILGYDVMVGVTTKKNDSKYYQTGGTMTVGRDFKVAAVSKYPTLSSISGGSLQITGALNVGPGRGTFEVVGSGSTINAGTYTQNVDSTLKAVIGAAGITPIQISGAAVFAAGATLGVEFAQTPVPGTYTLMVAGGGITDGGINNWSSISDHITYTIESGTTLKVTYHADSDPSRSGTEPGAICTEVMLYDLNSDCIVDLFDFAELAGSWLECGFNVSAACVN